MAYHEGFAEIPEVRIGNRLKTPSVNILKDGRDNWKFHTFCDGEAYLKYDGTTFTIDIINAGDADYSIQLVQDGIRLEKGCSYEIDFDVCSEVPRNFGFAISSPDREYKRYLDDQKIILNGRWETHRITFKMNDETDDNARVEFNLGNNESTCNVEIRNIRFEKLDKTTHRRRKIGVCGSWEDAENYNMFLHSLMIPEITDNFVVMSYTFPKDTSDEDEMTTGLMLADAVTKDDFAAIIVFAQMMDKKIIQDKIIKNCTVRGIPVFFLEQEREGVINCVFDYAGGFEKVVSHILDEHKCKKVKMIAGFKDNPYSIERENVYKNMMHKRGLEVDSDDIIYCDFWDATTLQKIDAMIKNGMEVPEAFICANDSMAVGVCDALARNGYNVPDDVIVSGFDGTWYSQYHMPAITTASLDYVGLARFIVDVIDGNFDWKKGKTIRHLVDYQLSINESCGCKEDGYNWQNKVSCLVSENQDYFRHMLEMGKFISHAISLADMDEAMLDLQHYLWLWADQYYFAGLTDANKPRYVDTLLHGNNGEYTFGEKYYNLDAQVPEMDGILERDSGINIMLFSQIRHAEKAYGYLCCGYKDLTLRAQQRFEEFALYMSSVVISVSNNMKLLNANKAISKLSEMDYLTGLYNRRGFFRKIKELLSNPKNKGKLFSLFSIDMDGLKKINDTYGHQEGDNSLMVLARALSLFIGEKGICARFGGDEFAIAAVGDVDIGDGLVDMRKRIAIHTSSDPRMEGKEYDIVASIGISECIISDDNNIEDIMKLADIRMYKDKQKRKGLDVR